jgi:transcriptional regulator with XRE-family HTH domain
MVNVQKLKGRRVELGYTVDELAKKMGMCRRTLSKKLSDKSGDGITVREIHEISEILGITDYEDYFFAKDVREA